MWAVCAAASTLRQQRRRLRRSSPPAYRRGDAAEPSRRPLVTDAGRSSSQRTGRRQPRASKARGPNYPVYHTRQLCLSLPSRRHAPPPPLPSGSARACRAVPGGVNPGTGVCRGVDSLASDTLRRYHILKLLPARNLGQPAAPDGRVLGCLSRIRVLPLPCRAASLWPRTSKYRCEALLRCCPQNDIGSQRRAAGRS
jgi:hypothetical protein